MTINLKHIHTILNSEGDIASILKNESDELFIMARTNLGIAQIICSTNRFNLQLYLTSRITLKQLFLLSQSEHYTIITDNKAVARFFEIDSDNTPKELNGIQYGNELFHLLPKGVRTDKTANEILELLPPIDEGVKLLIDEDITISNGQVQFFRDESVIQLEQIESETQNPSEYDYLSVPLTNGTGKLLCRLSPELLKLFLTNSITIQELFKSQMDKEFYYKNKQGNIYKIFYTDGLEGFIDKLSYGNLTYFSLPSTIDNPIETWDYYTRNIVVSGYGILPVDFQREYPVTIKIERRTV